MKVNRSAPLYRQIADNLRNAIFTCYKPGEELPGDNQLSRELGVSSLTVREALAVLCEEGLVERRVGSGSRVVVPRIGKNQVVAVLIDKDIGHPRFPAQYLARYEKVRLAFREHGIRVKLYTGEPQLEDFPQHITSVEFVEDLYAGRLAAVFVLVGYSEKKHVDYAMERNIPWVGMGVSGHAPIQVAQDKRTIIDQVVTEFAQQNRKNIAILGWQGFWDTEVREREYLGWFKSSVEKYGLTTRKEWMRLDVYPGLPGAGWSQIRTLWTAGNEKPDAVLFLDDVLYMDAQPALSRFGLSIPEELMVAVVSHRPEYIQSNIPIVVAKWDIVGVTDGLCKKIMQCLTEGVIEPSKRLYGSEILVASKSADAEVEAQIQPGNLV